jgi:hypothetical protein
MLILSHIQAARLLQARHQPTLTISPDLELTTVTVTLTSDGVTFPDGPTLDWQTVEEIADSENSCFTITADGPEKIQAFGEQTNRVYTLYPTESAPTMLVSGFPMHRIKGTNPHKDTLSKIKTIQPVTGPVLDTNMGLGYTAIQAAKTATSVLTVELDPAVEDICRQNPWSQALFTDPKITRMIGDSFDVVMDLNDNAFTRIIHDPPTFSLAGDLYSQDFYAELYRILAKGGRLFHYVGDLDSQHGKRVSHGSVQRLQAVGFKNVTARNDAFGLVAYK